MTDQVATEATVAGASVPAEAVEEKAIATTPEAEAAAPVETTEETESAGAEDASDKRPSGYQRAKQKALENQIRAERAEAELAEMRKQLGDNAPIPGLGPKPQEKDYPDFFEYQAELAAWSAERRMLARQQGDRDFQARQSQLSAQEEIAERLEASAEKARRTIPDFEKVMTEAQRRGVQAREDVVREIRSSEKAALIEYHLCKPENAALLRELNDLAGPDLARAVGRLEGRLSYPKARTETKAPPPLTPVNGGAAPSRDLASISYEEYKKQRMAS